MWKRVGEGQNCSEIIRAIILFISLRDDELGQWQCNGNKIDEKCFRANGQSTGL